MSFESLAIILAALSFGSFCKGLTGLGLPLVATPVIAAFLGVQHAVAVLVIPAMVSNALLMWEQRAHARALRDLPVLTLVAAVGSVFGTWSLVVLPDRVLALLVAASVGAFLLVLLFQPNFRLGYHLSRFISPWVGFVAGAAQGATGISGPVVGTYLRAFDLEPRAYVFAAATWFQGIGLIQIVALWQFGVLTEPRLYEGLLAVVPILVIVPLAAKLTGIIPRRSFEGILMVFLVIMGLKLAASGIFGV